MFKNIQDNIINRIMPSDIAWTSVEHRRQIHITIGIAFLGLYINGALSIIWWVRYNAPLLALPTIFLWVSCGVSLCCIRFLGKPLAASWIIIIGAYITFTWSIAISGGIHAGAINTLAIVPLLGVLMRGIRPGIIMMIVCALTTLFFGFATIWGIMFPMMYDPKFDLEITLSGLLPIIFSTTLSSVSFEYNRKKAQSLLEAEKLSVQRKVNESIKLIRQQEQEAYTQNLKVRGLQREFEMAADIQRRILPQSLPQIPGYDIAAFLRMALAAGGDLYDVAKINDKEYLLVIGDVSGKGMSAALYMSAALNVLRTEIVCFTDGIETPEQTKISPAKLLKIVNTIMKGTMPPGSFVTLFLGVLNIETHELRYSSGGHDPCVVWSPHTKSWKLLNTEGQACGAVSTKIYNRFVEEKSAQIEIGDYLIWNTDGITEAKNMDNERFSDEQYWEKIKRLKGSETPEEVISCIVRATEAFSGETDQYDDITLLCLRRNS